MEFLTDPNIGYVLLVLGSILTLLAIVTPGTGMLEIGALFSLVLSGYVAYKLGFNLWALIILVLMFIPFVYAIRKPNRSLYLLLSILMLIVGSMYLFPSKGFIPSVNPWLVITISLLSGAFTWLVVNKSISALHARPSHDLTSLVGLTGEAKTAIHTEGSVQVDGELWTARSEKRIPPDKKIRVISRDGFTLLVEQDDQE